MFGRFFPILVILSTCTVLGDSYVSGSSRPVFALVGEDAVLPCLLDPTVSEKVETVEWSKPGLNPNVVYLYRDGYETHVMKNPAYEHRTSLFMKELKRGNYSLLLSKVKLSDAGTYRCHTPLLKTGVSASVELQVGAVSQPVIVIKADSSGVFLQCEAKCWFPRPEIQWLDGDGSNITAEPTRRKDDDSGCFTVTSRVTVPDTATNRFTCRVQQQEINQTREAETQIPADCMKSCTKEIVIPVFLTILPLVISGVVAYFGWRKWRHDKDAKNQKTTSSVPPAINEASENRDNVIEELKSRVADLEKQLSDQNDEIHKLSDQIKKRHLPVVCQHDQPTISCVSIDPTGTTDSKSLLDGSRPCNLPQDHSPKAGNLTTHDNDPKPSTSPHSAHPNLAKAPKPGSSTQNKNQTRSLPASSRNPHRSTADLSEGSVSTYPSAKKPNQSLRTKSVSLAERPLSISSLRHIRCSSLSSASVLSNNRFRALVESDPEIETLLS